MTAVKPLMREREVISGLTRVLPFRPKTYGFSLLELLAVIVVIAIIISLILPSLSHAKAAALSANCQSNLRQQAVAVQMYRDTFKFYPAAAATLEGSDIVLEFASFLLPYTKSQSLFRCPAAESPYAFNTNDLSLKYQQRKRSYGVNYKGTAYTSPPGFGLVFDSDSLVSSGIFWRNLPENAVAAPGSFIVLGDSQADGTNDLHLSTMVSDGNLKNQRWPGARHKKGSNLSFADGHIEWRTQRLWLKRSPETRALWNYDNQPHEETWGANEQSVYDQLIP